MTYFLTFPGPYKIGKDGEIERLSTEVSELHKSKRQLMELLENKDLEISEKNATIKSYLDKIVCTVPLWLLPPYLHILYPICL